MILNQVARKWDNVSIAPDTDWFSNDLFAIERNSRAVKHNFQLSCPTATVVNMQLKYNDVTKIYTFNASNELGADEGFIFSIVLHKDMSYNIQHKTETQNVSVIITESANIDL